MLVLTRVHADLEDLKKLPYVRAALAESLRMYPQPPILIRRSLAADVLPAPLNGDPAGYPIGKGADIFISVWNLHRYVAAPSRSLPVLIEPLDLSFHRFWPDWVMTLLGVQLASALIFTSFLSRTSTGTLLHQPDPCLSLPVLYRFHITLSWEGSYSCMLPIGSADT